MSDLELLDMPYNRRRIIVVSDSPHAATSGRMSSRVIRAVAPAAGIYGVAALVAFDLVKARKAMRQGGQDLVRVSSADATQLQFPVGHPRGKVAYIGHPVDPPVYIPVADFHRFLFEHKVAEALRLIRSLGAITVEVERLEGWDQSIGVKLGVAPGVSQPDVNASAGQEQSNTRAVLSTMRLKPIMTPSIPSGCVWLPHEPLWQEVAEARLESGLDSFVLDVRSTDDYGVNASLKSLVLKAGLDAGGAFVEHRSTLWRLQGTFS